MVPIYFAGRKWINLSVNLKIFVAFLFSEFILNIISNYLYSQHINNLFLYYYYSFFQNFFIFLFFISSLNLRKEKFIFLFFMILNFVLIFYDFRFISQIGINYVSGITIGVSLFLGSIYCLSATFSLKENLKNSLTNSYSFILLAIILHFFVKTIDTFITKFLLEDQNNAVLWMQEKTIFYYFIFLALLIYSYSFFKIKNVKI